MDWFLYDNSLRPERVKYCEIMSHVLLILRLESLFIQILDLVRCCNDIRFLV